MPGRELVSSAIPQFFPSHWLQNSPEIVYSDFPSRIRIGYVLRRNGSYEYLMQEEVRTSSVTVPELHEFALKNLHALPMPGFSVAKTPGGNEAFLADSVDNFTAARILLPAVRSALVEHLGPEYFAAIPCRDWFFCWSKEQHTEFQERNRVQAREVFLKDDYNLTPDILLVAESGFTLQLEQKV